MISLGVVLLCGMPGSVAVQALTFAPDGKALAVARANGDLLVARLTGSRSQSQTFSTGRPLACLAFSPQGDRLALGWSDGGIAVWRFPSMQALWQGKVPVGTPNDAAFSHDGRQLAWSTEPTEHGYVFDASSGALKKTLFLLGNGMDGVRFLPDGKTLLTGGQRLTVWDLSRSGHSQGAYEPTGAFRVHENVMGWTTGLDTDASGRTVLACGAASDEDEGRTRSVVLVDPVAGKVRYLAKGQAITHAVSLDRKGKWGTAVDSDGMIRVWRLSDGKLLRTWRGCDRELFTVAFSPDGRSIATGEDTGKTKIWDSATGSLNAEF